jgi:hypothetical protein
MESFTSCTLPLHGVRACPRQNKVVGLPQARTQFNSTEYTPSLSRKSFTIPSMAKVLTRTPVPGGNTQIAGSSSTNPSNNVVGDDDGTSDGDDDDDETGNVVVLPRCGDDDDDDDGNGNGNGNGNGSNACWWRGRCCVSWAVAAAVAVAVVVVVVVAVVVVDCCCCCCSSAFTARMSRFSAWRAGSKLGRSFAQAGKSVFTMNFQCSVASCATLRSASNRMRGRGAAAALVLAPAPVPVIKCRVTGYIRYTGYGSYGLRVIRITG